jgi:hypothetical protein
MQFLITEKHHKTAFQKQPGRYSSPNDRKHLSIATRHGSVDWRSPLKEMLSANIPGDELGLGPMSKTGQKAKYSPGADVFRFAPDSGHPPSGSVFRRTHEPADVPLAVLELALVQPTTKQLVA